jgi:DNA-directed RNA polymerase subunit K/omega
MAKNTKDKKIKPPKKISGNESDDSDIMVNVTEQPDQKEEEFVKEDDQKTEDAENIDEDDDDDDLNDNVEVDDEDHELEETEVQSDNYESDTDNKSECLYNEEKNSDDEYEEDEIDTDDVDNDDSGEFLKPEERRTKAQLFHFEYVRLLEDRTEQILRGSKKLIKNSDHLTPIQVAKLEIKNNVIPLKIIRTLPNNLKELWTVKELDHSMYDLDP